MGSSLFHARLLHQQRGDSRYFGIQKNGRPNRAPALNTDALRSMVLQRTRGPNGHSYPVCAFCCAEKADSGIQHGLQLLAHRVHLPFVEIVNIISGLAWFVNPNPGCCISRRLISAACAAIWRASPRPAAAFGSFASCAMHPPAHCPPDGCAFASSAMHRRMR